MSLEKRATIHAALGDPRRLSIVDQLALSDRTVAELSELVEMRTNLLAHHLDILESASLIERNVSEGDHRRKYVSLCWDSLPSTPKVWAEPAATVAFVCTHNSARSQFAAALWQQITGRPAISAGSQPAKAVHPMAIKAASGMGVDLSRAVPGGYERIVAPPDLVVSVCDRVRESELPPGRNLIHWSVADPVQGGTLQSFRNSFAAIASRLERLTSMEEPCP
jgi:protein-tyrosine-phosphatase/DNA-binding transcriptional ArsR family regulator